MMFDNKHNTFDNCQFWNVTSVPRENRKKISRRNSPAARRTALAEIAAHLINKPARLAFFQSGREKICDMR